MLKLTERDGAVRLMLKVVPGSSRDRIVGVLGDALKVAVSKPPQDGAANRAVIKLLADALNVPSANVTIIRGHATARKEVSIKGVKIDDVQSVAWASRP